MKIISKIKDYYDHIQHTYYLGGDHQICYLRNKINKNNITIKSNDHYTIKHRTNLNFKYLAVAGKRYQIFSELEYDEEHYYKSYRQYKLVLSDNNELERISDDTVIQLSKEINQPVFTFYCIDRDKGKSTYEIDEDIPILSNLGLASFIDPLTMYNEIYYFIANVLRQNPDTIPPVELDNQCKILQHGFDKQSFKHRN